MSQRSTTLHQSFMWSQAPHTTPCCDTAWPQVQQVSTARLYLHTRRLPSFWSFGKWSFYWHSYCIRLQMGQTHVDYTPVFLKVKTVNWTDKIDQTALKDQFTQSWKIQSACPPSHADGKSGKVSLSTKHFWSVTGKQPCRIPLNNWSSWGKNNLNKNKLS